MTTSADDSTASSAPGAPSAPGVTHKYDPIADDKLMVKIAEQVLNYCGDPGTSCAMLGTLTNHLCKIAGLPIDAVMQLVLKAYTTNIPLDVELHRLLTQHYEQNKERYEQLIDQVQQAKLALAEADKVEPMRSEHGPKDKP